jgi:hypothetical protein
MSADLRTLTEAEEAIGIIFERIKELERSSELRDLRELLNRLCDFRNELQARYASTSIRCGGWLCTAGRIVRPKA